MFTERRGTALVLTLSEPATRNALSPQACDAGVEAIGTAESDPGLRAVVLRGDGAHFCAGGNLQRLADTRRSGDPAQQAASMSHFHRFVEALQATPLPVIAAVEGHAAGGGAALALACDLVVASEEARFTLSYGRIGASPDGGSTFVLARALTRAQALRMLWLPAPMTARDWLALGLVDTVVDPGHALAGALELAAALAAMAPNAVASVKELVNRATQRSLDEQLNAEKEHFVRNLFHQNAGEGIAAFLDKRAPQFR
jgi:enoyl-CoA hydratase/carnithine racemase